MDATSIEVADTDSPQDAEIVAALAARTFGDACPPWLSRQYVQEFIDKELSAARFASWIAEPDAHVVLASADGAVHGYALWIDDVHAEVPSEFSGERTAYLSKLYVDADWRGDGIAAALMQAVIDGARAAGCVALWLGVNDENARARTFYAKWGMRAVGRRDFAVGAHRFVDDLFAMPLNSPTG